MRTLILFLLVALRVLAVDPAPLPQPIRDAKTVYIVNQNIEDTIHDHVYDRFRHWPDGR